MGALLAVASAVSYGISDVIGGVAARKASFIRVALVGQLAGFLTMAAAALLLTPAPPTLEGVAWGALSGVGTGAAMTFLFRGIARGAMSVVVPVSAVGGVALPVLVGVALLGERPTAVAWVGIVLAVPALWWVSRGDSANGAGRGGVLDAPLAGVGIAVQYLTLAQAGGDSGVWPVVAGRVTAVVAVVALFAVLRPTAQRERQHHDLAAAGAGVLAGLALVCYQLATRTELVTVAVVLSSLYPVIPVVLGVVLLAERLTWRQLCGLGGALAATVLIAIG
ncbi:EamA family transporter [Pseudonocardia sp. TRM90224]|uniref:EamA family transporter n=1 Tax=Pseudonocardia sp. TRM90224 TaxID=2812678 RepID=UPI001E616716|nr:EamA family transporter [Pseudonocardia sp. TRM90224]